ncbi:MAG: LysR substrate-binding domain-containing protein [Methylobacterium sp.]|jgi:DNA-binding transcriptional LysR family regulator|nr:LysR family transcriptional regulator [Methylobacterium sp.]MCA3639303.1 LysR family transcriptional regulator [Methylobacterium sp.]
MPRRKLPPLNALAIFEEVAVRRSCSEAALHLGLTQSAVSKQVQAMERFIGAPLFSRAKGGLVPNAVGGRLLSDVQPILDAMERILNRAMQEKSNRRVVILRTLATISDRWLLPRLRGFIEAHPEIEIQFSTFLLHSEYDRGGAEVEIRFGSGPWLDADATPITGRHVVLIAPPDTPPDCPLPELLKKPLFVHAQARDAFAEFYTAMGLEAPTHWPSGSTFDVYQVLVKAVTVGLGVGLVPRCLVEEELATGAVVNPNGYGFQSRLCYQLLVPHQARPLSQAAQALHDWILGQAEPDVASLRPGPIPVLPIGTA